METALQWLQDNSGLVITYGIRFVVALAIFFIGRWLARMVSSLSQRALDHRQVDKAVGSFLSSIIYALIVAATVLVAFGHLGHRNHVLYRHSRRRRPGGGPGAAGLTVELCLRRADHPLPPVQGRRFCRGRRRFRLSGEDRDFFNRAENTGQQSDHFAKLADYRRPDHQLFSRAYPPHRPGDRRRLRCRSPSGQAGIERYRRTATRPFSRTRPPPWRWWSWRIRRSTSQCGLG